MLGHIPPKLYIVDWEALALTTVENVNPPDRKLAPGSSRDVTELDVVVLSSDHVPFPLSLSLGGVNRHNEALDEVEQAPV
jgi:hypothetical protein